MFRDASIADHLVNGLPLKVRSVKKKEARMNNDLLAIVLASPCF